MANNLILNRLFTQATLHDLLEGTYNITYENILKKYTNYDELMTNNEAIGQIYNYLKKQYRNEYYYKNTILNKLLLGVHSITTTTALTEIPIASSKADFVLINGKAVVYEIKTELDTLDRLDSQIENYYKAFDHVCVITCEEYAKYLSNKFSDTNVGIYILTKKNTIRRLKEPIISKSMLDLKVIFKILNKPEFEDILKEYYGKLPQSSQVKYYRCCKEQFIKIPKDIAYRMFLIKLKQRNVVKDKESFKRVPYELKSLIYFSQYSESDYKNLENFLFDRIGGKY